MRRISYLRCTILVSCVSTIFTNSTVCHVGNGAKEAVSGNAANKVKDTAVACGRAHHRSRQKGRGFAELRGLVTDEGISITELSDAPQTNVNSASTAPEGIAVAPPDF
jgi:hypothetical protein